MPVRHPRTHLLLLLIFVITSSVIVSAQDNSAEPQQVQIRAEDGLNLSGDYYPAATDAPAVLLLHQMYTTRTSWRRLVNPLREAGFHVLNVDLRGYGQTRGRINWTHAQSDTQAWLTWLAEQPGVRTDRLFVVGSSMGANLALVGCAEADSCAGAVALSPGLSYFGVRTGDAIAGGSPSLVIYADGDRYPARDVPRMAELVADAGLETLTTLVYSGRDHGIDLLVTYDDIVPALIEWIQARSG
jgi:dienelactone hydrolase